MNDDNELIRSIGLKDRNAFEQLYRRYYPRVYRFSLRIVKQPGLAEEAANDTFYAVWQNADSFQHKSSLSTWILGITYRQSMKSLQKQTKHTQNSAPLDDVENQISDSSSKTPESQTEFAELEEQIYAGIDKLSDSHRAVVQLTAMGLAYDDISEIVGCPTNTVKTRMYHARKQLKRYLTKRNITTDVEGFEETC